MAMVIYHFSWDLDYFNFIAADVTLDLGWRLFARLIAGSFLFLVGVSLVLATRGGLNRRAYLVRLGQIAAGAIAVTIATRFAFGDAFVFFGILHNIAVASLLGLAFLRVPIWAVGLTALISLALPWLATSPIFDAPIFWWTGLATVRPESADFIPIFPWFAIVLLGIVCARMTLTSTAAIEWLARPIDGSIGRLLRFAGRNSLVIYLVHQPILFGIVYVLATTIPIAGSRASVVELDFLKSCQSSCVKSGGTSDLCGLLCNCTADRIGAQNMWAEVGASDGKDATRRQVDGFVRACASQLPPPGG